MAMTRRREGGHAAAKEGWQAAVKDGDSTTVDVSTRWRVGEKDGSS